MDKFKRFGRKSQGMFVLALLVLAACNQENGAPVADPLVERYYAGKGTGPVTSVILGEPDPEMARRGETLFVSNCVTCHSLEGEKKIGPGLKNITSRRTPEYIMNMMLDPLGMTKNDSLAGELLNVYLAQMTPLNLKEKDARDILEYLRVTFSEK
jgi:mono/diheme cytochrome c family protein